MTFRIAALVLVAMAPLSAQAGTSIEAGSTPLVGVNYERQRISLGIGLGFSWDNPPQLVDFVQGNVIASDPFLFVIKPSLQVRYFLSLPRKVQPLLAAKVGRDFPFATDDNGDFANDYEDRNKYWRFSIGAGARMFVVEDWSLGGEAMIETSILNTDGNGTWASGSGAFHVLLQYHI